MLNLEVLGKTFRLFSRFLKIQDFGDSEASPEGSGTNFRAFGCAAAQNKRFISGAKHSPPSLLLVQPFG